MSKYYLVASHYNIYTREYENEARVNLNGVDLSSLQKIDKLTSNHTHEELLKMIGQELNRNDINHIVIKYFKTKESTPIYYQVIENNPKFTECTTNTNSDTYQIFDKIITAPIIDSNCLLLSIEKAKLRTILENKNIDEFKKIYTNHNVFSNLVINYMQSSFDEQEEQLRILSLIEKEFSRYKTFRGWIVGQEKLRRNNLQNQNNNAPRNINQPTQQLQQKEIIPKSIKEHEKEYEKNFKEEQGISYREQQTYSYNTHKLDEDKEEFLDEYEYEEMINYNEEQISKTRRR